MDDKYVIIYAKNGLKVEVKFSFGNCNMKANMYTVRYSGIISKIKKYLNWKVDYISCGDKNRIFKTFGRGILIGGIELINQIGYNPEDMETEGFDDQFSGQIIDKIYDLKVSSYEEKKNK